MFSPRTEPVVESTRPSHMLLMKLRRAVPVAVLAASLTALSAGCGQDRPATGTPPSDSVGGDHSPSTSATGAPPSTGGSPSAVPPANPSTGPSSGGTSTVPVPAGTHGIESRVVYLSAGVRRPPTVHSVVASELELSRFPSWFAGSDPTAAREIAERSQTTDFSRNVLVGWVETTGCSQVTGVALLATGDRLTLGVSQPKPPPECLVANQVTVVFEVPRDRMPKQPVFGVGRQAATPPGPGTTVAFTHLDAVAARGQRAKGSEVTEAAQLNAYLAGLPGGGASAVRAQLAAHPPKSGERRFGFQLSGCRSTGATLTVSPEGRVSASPTGGENIRCIRPESYAAVLAVPVNVLPTRVTAID
ncbi:hypothetical protein [Streptomyces sp. SPB162]|uniref:hypothetical protein n=1 Tax=Streptomyces sp. SPB162 TaxID=2940560 RepID=UPI00240662C1|nr:hypothetical protein [Streptomyces sp. SPB162]MDF9813348.1 hypothetical protein [Streptomyces sp. SPB162]